MRQVSVTNSTYTADVSGACSALYELGGLSVIHDASGCNSTYNTHDEPRWYDRPSMVYITGLAELEALLGSADERLVSEVSHAAEQLQPRFISLVGSPIPHMMGTDLPALARLIEQQVNIPCWAVEATGMNSYQRGAGAALAAYAERMIERLPRPTAGRRLNLLGATPLDFSTNTMLGSLMDLLRVAGWEIISCWAMNSTPQQLERASLADVNLVVSSSGLPLARQFHQRFHTPWVVGLPVGRRQSARLLRALERAIAEQGCHSLYADAGRPADQTVIIGEPISALAYAMALTDTGAPLPRVLCPLEPEPELDSPLLRWAAEEDELAAALAQASVVIADPLYQPLVPPTARLERWPHEACSGRMWRSEIPDLINKFA